MEKLSDDFKESVSFQPEVDLFVGLVIMSRSLKHLSLRHCFSRVISSAIVVQLRELESALDPPFETMSRTIWASLSNVSGPSQYVLELVRNADSFTAILNPLVEQKKYLRNFYDKAAAYVKCSIDPID